MSQNTFEAGSVRRKHKPKPRISELDEEAAKGAKHRRAQSSRAQRAYRQRKEHAIASLTVEVEELKRALDGLNKCFLTLTDELLSSPWVADQPTIAESIKRSVVEFISINERSSKHCELSGNEELEKPLDTCEHSSSPANSAKSALGHRLTVHFASMPLNADASPNFVRHTVYGTSPGSPVSASGHTYELKNTVPSNLPVGSRFPTLPTTLHSFSDQVYSNSIKSFYPPSPQSSFVGFVQRLHTASIRAAYHVLLKEGETSAVFKQVFSDYRLMYSRDRLIPELINKLRTTLSTTMDLPKAQHALMPNNRKHHQLFTPLDVATLYYEHGFYYDQNSDTLVKRSLLDEPLTDPIQGSQAIEGSRFTMKSILESHNPLVHGLNINVSELIGEILTGARCIGDSPAFRKEMVFNAMEKAMVQFDFTLGFD